MWYVYEIFSRDRERYFTDICTIDEDIEIVFRDYDDENRFLRVKFDERLFNRKSLLNYLDENYGIKEVIGIGTILIFELNKDYIQLLDLIDYDHAYENKNLKSCNYSVTWCAESDNIMFIIDNKYINIMELLVNYSDCYEIIEDNKIIVLSSESYVPCYKILCDTKYFIRLVTKLRVLKG